jgi:hypothetical protein
MPTLHEVSEYYKLFLARAMAFAVAILLVVAPSHASRHAVEDLVAPHPHNHIHHHGDNNEPDCPDECDFQSEASRDSGSSDHCCGTNSLTATRAQVVISPVLTAHPELILVPPILLAVARDMGVRKGSVPGAALARLPHLDLVLAALCTVVSLT